MKKSLAIVMTVLLLLSAAISPANAASMKHHHDGANYDVLVNSIANQKRGLNYQFSKSLPGGETKTVVVSLAVPFGAHYNNTYYYEDEFYAGTLRVARTSVVTYADGTKDTLVTYAGEVKRNK
jgi:uncharacterized membrane protein